MAVIDIGWCMARLDVKGRVRRLAEQRKDKR